MCVRLVQTIDFLMENVRPGKTEQGVANTPCSCFRMQAIPYHKLCWIPTAAYHRYAERFFAIWTCKGTVSPVMRFLSWIQDNMSNERPDGEGLYGVG